ncbi:CHRD domain-containing protein [Sphingosinicella sp. CPCC 101087]|uniref:CHRD domain-containing protein n=1 Tax=Sphingosinicella sp. CPCC 101087 TaxID=2497754 RepID=UPI0013EC7C70|nr:CHRD domain-containing protein [Sphingosinicella sp. CPCC 101087]
MRYLRMGVGAAALLLASGCATAPEDQRATLAVTLTGVQEVPGPGDADGTGTAEIRVDPRAAQVCWNLYVRQIDPATAAHIHRGPAGTAGPPVVTLTTPDANGRSEGCTVVDQPLARELVMRSHDFYVNVHTASHPAGAVRGQLRGGIIRQQRQRR